MTAARERASRRAGALVVVALVACGGGTSGAPAPAAGTGAPVAPATQPSDAQPAPSTPEECAALADHLVELTLTERRASGADFTEEDAEAAKLELRSGIAEGCATLPRATVQCGLTATSTAAVAACP